MYTADGVIFSYCRSVHVSLVPNSLQWLLLTIKVERVIFSRHLTHGPACLAPRALQLHFTSQILHCSYAGLFPFFHAIVPLHKLVFICLLLLLSSHPSAVSSSIFVSEKPSLTPRIATQSVSYRPATPISPGSLLEM